MQLVKKTSILHILCYQDKLVSCDTDTHVKHDIGMLEV